MHARPFVDGPSPAVRGSMRPDWRESTMQKSTVQKPTMQKSTEQTRKMPQVKALSDKEQALLDAYWRAANYLSVGQIYLYDNPLLKKPLTQEHVKPRLLGHWGTTPGLNFIYVHLNRIITKYGLETIYIAG